jgi:hypothetical protein
MRRAWLLLGLVACGGGHEAPIGVPCDELTRVACSERADCALDVCFACSCTPSHVSCRRADAPPFECPLLECPMPECCASNPECQDGTCFPPGQSASPCGNCTDRRGDCREDPDCQPLATHRVCDPIECSCTAEKQCTNGCSLAGCPQEGTTCNRATERCEPSPCTAGCPVEFDCGDAGRCVRRACRSDAECVDGFCVNGGCYAGLGSCQVPAP